MPFYPAFKNSPLKGVVLTSLSYDSLKVGMKVALKTVERTSSTGWYNYRIGETFVIDTITRITPKRTKLVLENSGEVVLSKKEIEFYAATEAIEAYIKEFDKRAELVMLIRRVQESVNAHTETKGVRSECDLSLIPQVMSLPQKEVDIQYTIFTSAFKVANSYTEAAKEQLKRKNDEYEKKYGVKKA